MWQVGCAAVLLGSETVSKSSGEAGLQRKQLQRMGQDMGHGESPGISSRWHPDGRPRRQAKPAVSVVGLGDASTGNGGCISGGPSGCPKKLFVDFMRQQFVQQHDRPGGLRMFFVLQDEFRASKTCSSCWIYDKQGRRRGMQCITVAGRQVWKLVRCQQCEGGRVCDRDITAARCMCALGTRDLYGREHVASADWDRLHTAFSRQAG